MKYLLMNTPANLSCPVSECDLPHEIVQDILSHPVETRVFVDVPSPYRLAEAFNWDIALDADGKIYVKVDAGYAMRPSREDAALLLEHCTTLNFRRSTHDPI